MNELLNVNDFFKFVLSEGCLDRKAGGPLRGAARDPAGGTRHLRWHPAGLNLRGIAGFANLYPKLAGLLL